MKTIKDYICPFGVIKYVDADINSGHSKESCDNCIGERCLAYTKVYLKKYQSPESFIWQDTCTRLNK
jgi:hypothetical protein